MTTFYTGASLLGASHSGSPSGSAFVACVHSIFFQFLITVIFIVEVMNNIAKIVLSWNIIIGEASFVLFSVFVGAATTTYRRKRSSQTARAQAKARRSSVTFCTSKYPIYITVHHSVTQQHNKAHATSKTIKPYTK
jgi:hypothetical protein